jgi:hypothetical protein
MPLHDSIPLEVTVMPGVTLAVLGYHTILSGFFLSLLTIRRR